MPTKETKETKDDRHLIFREGEAVTVKQGQMFGIELVEGTYSGIVAELKGYDRDLLEFQGKTRKQAYKGREIPIITTFKFTAKGPGKGEITFKTVHRPDHKLSLAFPVTITK